MAAGAAIELRRERADRGGEDRIVAIHDRRLQPFEQRRVALAEQPQRLAQLPAAHVEIIGDGLLITSWRERVRTKFATAKPATARMRTVSCGPHVFARRKGFAPRFPRVSASGNIGGMAYQPTPIDTSAVTLAPELQALTERLAENAHDLWAAQRFADGWTFGPKRDDAAKKHPCLVPYSDLPESEKEYDRRTALGTLRAIAALGYTIRSGAAR